MRKIEVKYLIKERMKVVEELSEIENEWIQLQKLASFYASRQLKVKQKAWEK
jgi:hypothetical protein